MEKMTGHSFPSKFPGWCGICKARVPAGTGAVRRSLSGKGWHVQCDACEGRIPADTTGTIRLTAQQTAVVESMSARQSIFVQARAGTGKTFTVVQGLKAMDAGDRKRTAVLAFNREMADELRDKCPPDTGFVRTLDGLAYRAMIKAFGKEGVGFELSMNRTSQVSREVCKAEGFNTYSAVSKGATLARTFMNDAPDAIASRVQDFQIELPTVKGDSGKLVEIDMDLYVGLVRKTLARLRSVEKNKDGARVLSFEDAHELIATGDIPSIKFSTLVIDEAQDVSILNTAAIARALEDGGNVVAVGDDRQAIYRFRGADPSAVPALVQRFGLRILPLTQTRRCSKAVVALAQATVPDFEALPEAPEGSVTYPEKWYSDEVKNGEWVISRSNAPLLQIAMGFIRSSTPFRYLGRDALSDLKNWIGDLIGGSRNFPKLHDMSKDSFLDMVRSATYDEVLIAEERADERLMASLLDREEMIRALCTGPTAYSVLTRMNEISSAKDGSDGSDCVTLSTVHQAKGKEGHTIHVLRPTFFIQGGDPTEESNLWYVAITRAKENLVLAEFPPRRKRAN